ncbi:MAG TPA: hypothetical protein VN113_01065, partial [Caulobacter sp.]|nr:hypothetical protein [Caulobacter sp.]
MKPPVEDRQDETDERLDDDILDADASDEGDGEVLTADLPEALAGQRLDKVLAPLFPDLSRARLQSLIGEGR